MVQFGNGYHKKNDSRRGQQKAQGTRNGNADNEGTRNETARDSQTVRDKPSARVLSDH